METIEAYIIKLLHTKSVIHVSFINNILKLLLTGYSPVTMVELSPQGRPKYKQLMDCMDETTTHNKVYNSQFQQVVYHTALKQALQYIVVTRSLGTPGDWITKIEESWNGSDSSSSSSSYNIMDVATYLVLFCLSKKRTNFFIIDNGDDFYRIFNIFKKDMLSENHKEGLEHRRQLFMEMRACTSFRPDSIPKNYDLCHFILLNTLIYAYYCIKKRGVDAPPVTQVINDKTLMNDYRQYWRDFNNSHYDVNMNELWDILEAHDLDPQERLNMLNKKLNFIVRGV